VTAIDDDTGTGNRTINTTVRNINPTLEDLAVTGTIDEDGTVTLTGRIADTGTQDTHTVTIVWGDGNTSTIPVDPVTRTFPGVWHVYCRAGRARICRGQRPVHRHGHDGYARHHDRLG
jgi:hypothetical protein